jgi:hypothetical protein
MNVILSQSSATGVQEAPIGADPLKRFLNSLPKKALFLGSKCCCSSEKSVFYVAYRYKGSDIEQSFIWKGGEA